ncbi:fibronectin type III domain-containing protein [Motilibacter aurantiacus]|uniref:fibronectin type III domain-containing protein n=1 Tax=Motilibacter aurantiacus TaxID=2714955 RepID=UPI001409B91F|nr:fibronectin type III domain-containing protein [Motilibacter aurantiacus]NHC43928.1 fibronectin type III domain-containing protein [Motilibacter aurantiacus]
MLSRPRFLRTCRAAVLALATLAAGGLTATPASAGPVDCSADCITSLQTSQTRGTWFTLSTKTTVPTRISLKISQYLNDVDSKPALQYTPGSPSTSHFDPVRNLVPGTGYWFKVFATDQQGRSHAELGYVTTKTRIVTVKIDKITVLDDSDASGNGEISVHLKAGDAESPNYYHDHSVGSGGVLNPLWTREIEAPTSTKAYVELFDDDDDCWLGCGPSTNHLIPQYDTGTAWYGQWGTATYTIPAPKDSDPAFDAWPFTISSPGNSPVKFLVDGRLSISYVD